MELWWFMVPLALTSVVFVLIGALLCKIAFWVEKTEAGILILLISLVPSVLLIMSCTAWFLCNVFLSIWGPYLG